MSKQSLADKMGWKLENSYASLPSCFFTLMDPTPVCAPQLSLSNDKLAETLGLNAQALTSGVGIQILAGNTFPEGSLPLAQAYAGHQFGHFTKLGDGRALLIGEQITPTGQRLDIQLKGSGPTPYSRRGDGRATLGPMLREYIISEAMYALGIPTTRSLAVVTTGESVWRREEEKGAVLTRVAASHLRVGTFQYAAHWGSEKELRALAGYAISRHDPDLIHDEKPYLAFLDRIIRRQAKTVALWQLVGFIHGVMNTDNMTISGETIDYGPCAFMDTYNLATVFSSIDQEGRYAYGNQPRMAAWNLARLAETLLPLIDEEESQAIKQAEEAIGKFGKLYQQYWLDGMRRKLGLFDEKEEDLELIQKLLGMMQQYKADYTGTFIALTTGTLEQTVIGKVPECIEWLKDYKKRLIGQQKTQEEISLLMKSHNPSVIPRNHLVEEALEAAVKQNDYAPMDHLLDVLSNPYAYLEEHKQYNILPPFIQPYRTFCGT